MGKILKGLAAWVVALIVIIVVVVAAVGIYYGIALTHHPSVTTTTTSTSTTTTTTPTTTSTSTTSTPTSTSTSTTTTTTPTTTTTSSLLTSLNVTYINITTPFVNATIPFINTSNPQVLMRLVNLTSPPSTPVTITVWDTYSTSENWGFNQTVAEFEKLFPWINVKVTLTGISLSQYDESAKVGNAPNVYRVGQITGSIIYSSGLSINFAQYIPLSIVKIIAQQYLPEYVALDEFNNGTAFNGFPDDAPLIVLYYNKHFVPYPPNTTAQWIQEMEYVNTTYHVWGWVFSPVHYTAGLFINSFDTQDNGNYFYFTTNSKGQIIPALNSTAMIEFLEWLYNLSYVDHIVYIAPPGQNGAAGMEGQLFMSNKSAFEVDGLWDIGSYLKALGPNLGVWSFPINSLTGLRIGGGASGQVFIVSTPQASSATPLQMKAAIMFALFATSYQALLNLADKSGDIPTNLLALKIFYNQLEHGYLTPAYLNQIYEDALLNLKYLGLFKSLPPSLYQYYYYAVTVFDQYWSKALVPQPTLQDAYANIIKVVQDMEQQAIMLYIENGLLSSATVLLPPPALLISYVWLVVSMLIPPIVVRKR